MAQRVFITGGASGFGRALAERYAKEGWRVCLGDIHAERLAETAQALKAFAADVHTMRCDVTQEADLEAAAAWLEHNWGGVDVVINNAGVAAGGGIDETPLADWQWIIDINLLGVVRGCKAFVPLLRKQGSGHIVNVASMAGLIHPPMMSAYNATKAAVVALSETLHFELAPDNVRVSVICMSFFKTNLTETMRGTPTSIKTTQRLVDRSNIRAETIAKIAHDGIKRGDFRIITHDEGKKAFALKRYAPFGVYSRTMAKQTRRLLRRS